MENSFTFRGRLHKELKLKQIKDGFLKDLQNELRHHRKSI